MSFFYLVFIFRLLEAVDDTVAAETTKPKEDENSPDEEAKEMLEDFVVQGESDDAEVTEISPEAVSVIASTHDISAASTNTRLTESELQLGKVSFTLVKITNFPRQYVKEYILKVKPEWIADAEMTTCMLCCSKFTFILRRHHCRSCGRLLCAHCTSHRVNFEFYSVF